MRGKRAKSIRRYVDETFPMLSDEPLYKQRPDGQIVLHPSCKRGVYVNIKRNYKKRARGEY